MPDVAQQAERSGFSPATVKRVQVMTAFDFTPVSHQH